MNKILIAYIPVLHKGYVDLLEQGFSEIHLMQEDLVRDLGVDYIIRKDSIRSLPFDLVISAIRSWNLGDVYHLNLPQTKKIQSFDSGVNTQITLPDEDISRDFVEKYLSGKNVVFSPIFLRWHRDNVSEERQAQTHKTILLSGFEKSVMHQVFVGADKSFDWWRQTCAFFVRDGNILLSARNEHLPDEQAPYVFGDPRAIFRRGIHVELSTSEHAEARVIAEAARRGLPLEGGDIYCTDFPCPPCAKLVARSGIKRLFFKNGYTMLDSEAVLKNSGIEIIYVDVI